MWFSLSNNLIQVYYNFLLIWVSIESYRLKSYLYQYRFYKRTIFCFYARIKNTVLYSLWKLMYNVSYQHSRRHYENITFGQCNRFFWMVIKTFQNFFRTGRPFWNAWYKHNLFKQGILSLNASLELFFTHISKISRYLRMAPSTS